MSNYPAIHTYYLSGSYAATYSLGGLPTSPTVTSFAFSFLHPLMYVAIQSSTVYVYNPYTMSPSGSFNAATAVSGLAAAPVGGLLLASPSGPVSLHLENPGFPFSATITGISTNATEIKTRASTVFPLIELIY